MNNWRGKTYLILTSGDIADSLDRGRLGVYQFSLPKAASMSSSDSLLQSKSTAVTLQTSRERENDWNMCTTFGKPWARICGLYAALVSCNLTKQAAVKVLLSMFSLGLYKVRLLSEAGRVSHFYARVFTFL